MVSLCFLGCTQRPIEQKLVYVDTLLRHDCDSQAYQSINAIAAEELEKDQDRAYYNLLWTVCYHRMDSLLDTDSLIDFSIRYYRTVKDRNKLAVAYNYKGINNYKKKFTPANIRVAFYNLKQAEHLVDYLEDPKYACIIYENLIYVNMGLGHPDLCLDYSRKQYHWANVARSKFWQAYANLNLALVYFKKEKKDSANYYTTQCMSLLHYLSKKDASFVYATLGSLNMEQDTALARAYLEKSVDMFPVSYALHALSELYIKAGRNNKVSELYKLVAQRNNADSQLPLLQEMRRMAVDAGDYRRANALADEELQLIARWDKVQEQSSALQLQRMYDEDSARQEARMQKQLWLFIVVSVCMLSLLVFLLMHYRGLKMTKKQADNRLMQQDLEAEIAHLKDDNKSHTAAIGILRRKLETLTSDYKTSLQAGKERYDQIRLGDTTGQWSAKDYEDYLEYARVAEEGLMNEIATMYHDLTPKYMFFALLVHRQWPDGEIARVMCVSASTVRSMRSRLKKHQ